MDEKNIFDRINIIDGIAILFIVLFHELGGKNTPDAIFLTKFLATLGLCLFTFTSGFKLHFNHYHELEEKAFLKKYFKKRFVRLYKPYLGYTVMIFIPLYFTIILSQKYLGLHLESFDSFYSNLNITGLFKIMIGSNFISPQLWYLIVLLVITFVTFLVLYTSMISGLKVFFILTIIFSFMFQVQLEVVNNILAYMPIFIFGLLYSYNQMYKSHNKKTIILSLFFIVTFFIFVLSERADYTHNIEVILFGLTFPCFLFRGTYIIMKINKLKNIFTYFGKNSFIIYLFHWPLILPVLDRLVSTVYHFDYFIVPYLITPLAMILCIYVYSNLKKMKLNVIFE